MYNGAFLETKIGIEQSYNKILTYNLQLVELCGGLLAFLNGIIDRISGLLDITFTSFEDLKQFAINLNEKSQPMNTIIEVNLFESNANVS